MTSYKTIFGSHKGNMFQKALKFWIRPRAPRLALVVYTLLGVGLFRYVLMNTVGRLGRFSRYQTNYHIGTINMNNLLTFATNQTMFNEGWHLFAFFATNLPLLLSWYGEGMQLNGFTVFLFVVTLVNIYCVLLQRMNRAKIALMIETLIERGHRQDTRYKNWLALDLPEPVEHDEYAYLRRLLDME